MNRGHFLAAGLFREVERVFGDANGGGARDHLEAGDHILHHFVLQARVQVLGVLAEDHHVDVDIVKAGLQTGQRMDRTHVRVQIELFAQRDVDAGESAANGRGHRTLQAEMRPLDGFDHVWRQHLASLGDDAGIQIGPLPVNGDARRVHRADRSLRHLRADAIPWD